MLKLSRLKDLVLSFDMHDIDLQKVNYWLVVDKKVHCIDGDECPARVEQFESGESLEIDELWNVLEHIQYDIIISKKKV